MDGRGKQSKGKSSIVEMPNGYYTHENEKIIIGDKTLNALPIKDIKKHFGYIYVTKNTKEDKYYLGLRYKKSGTLSYIGSGKYLKYAIRKYGKPSFYKIIIDFADDLESLEDLEKFYIEEYFGYNITKSNLWYNIYSGKQRGGNSWLGYTKTDWKRRSNRISKSNTGRKWTTESRKQLSKSKKKLYKYSEKAHENVSVGTKKAMNTLEVANKINHYIQYPIYVEGKAYYSASEIARQYNLNTGYVRGRIIKGYRDVDIVTPPLPSNDPRRYRGLLRKESRIKDALSYPKIYYITLTSKKIYAVLAQSVIDIYYSLNNTLGIKIGRHSVEDIIKGDKSNYKQVANITYVENRYVEDKLRLLYVTYRLNGGKGGIILNYGWE